MAGFTPNEGENMIQLQVNENVTTDRGTDCELLMFTNSTGVDETITEATLTEPTGGGYARITISDASWTTVGDTSTYAKQTFTATGSDFVGSIYGYALVSKGTTPRIIDIEIDPNGPYTIVDGQSYDITLSNSQA